MIGVISCHYEGNATVIFPFQLVFTLNCVDVPFSLIKISGCVALAVLIFPSSMCRVGTTWSLLIWLNYQLASVGASKGFLSTSVCIGG